MRAKTSFLPRRRTDAIWAPAVCEAALLCSQCRSTVPSAAACRSRPRTARRLRCDRRPWRLNRVPGVWRSVVEEQPFEKLFFRLSSLSLKVAHPAFQSAMSFDTGLTPLNAPLFPEFFAASPKFLRSTGDVCHGPPCVHDPDPSSPPPSRLPGRMMPTITTASHVFCQQQIDCLSGRLLRTPLSTRACRSMRASRRCRGVGRRSRRRRTGIVRLWARSGGLERRAGLPRHRECRLRE